MTEIYNLIGEFQKTFRAYLAKKLDPTTLRNEEERGRTFANRNKLELSAFKQLVISNKSAFHDDFGKKAHNLPTWLDDLLEIRNKVAHYDKLNGEDRDEAIRLMRKISELAKLPTAYLDASRPTHTPADMERKDFSRPEKLMHNAELDGLIAQFSALSMKRTQAEYRVYKEGTGRGSIWIAKQRSGYRIVTTGTANSLKTDIERLTGKSAVTMQDRDHLWWKGLSVDEVRSILTALEEL